MAGHRYRTTRIHSFAALLTLNFGLMPAGLERRFSQRRISKT